MSEEVQEERRRCAEVAEAVIVSSRLRLEDERDPSTRQWLEGRKRAAEDIRDVIRTGR